MGTNCKTTAVVQRIHTGLSLEVMKTQAENAGKTTLGGLRSSQRVNRGSVFRDNHFAILLYKWTKYMWHGSKMEEELSGTRNRTIRVEQEGPGEDKLEQTIKTENFLTVPSENPLVCANFINFWG